MKNRITQYILIALILTGIAGGYFYYQSKASETLRGGTIAVPSGNTKKINASQVNKLTSGLVGYWTFDGADMTATTATDKSPAGGNNGTITGAVPAAGKIGQALNFNGTSDYVSNASAFNYTSESFSIGYWLRLTTLDTDSPGQGPAPIYKGSWRVGGYYSQINSSGSVGFTTNQSGANQTTSTATGVITAGTWNYILYTRSGSSVRIYVNGTDRTSSAASHIDPASSASAFQVGLYSNTIHTNGKIDEVRVYDRALSQSEITELYQQGQTKINASQDGKLESNLVGYWTMDGADTAWTSATAGTVADKSPVGTNTGTLTNMSQATSPAIGKIGQAMYFDGTDDSIAFNPASMNGAGAISISAWIHASGSTFGEGGILIRGNTFGTASPLLQIASGTKKVYFYISTASGNGDGNLTTAAAVPTGQWSHVAATWDGTNLYAYIDGIKDANTDTTVSHALKSNTAGRIGQVNGDTYFWGKIDEVRVYDRALSQSEVTELYNMGR